MTEEEHSKVSEEDYTIEEAVAGIYEDLREIKEIIK